jgi:Putative SAM-dependent methyltransferase
MKVCAFGGGPGTELLALSKHLINKRASGPHARISFTLLDRVPEWSETWHALESGIKAELRTHFGPFLKHPFSTSGTFVPFDMTKVKQYANLATLLCQDLFVLNYVVSEVTGDQQQFQDLVQVAASACHKGSKFLIVDRDQDDVVKAAQTLLTSAGLTASRVIKPLSRCMDTDEKPEVLDSYRFNINWRPRKWWVGTYGSNSGRGAFYLVGTKP